MKDNRIKKALILFVVLIFLMSAMGTSAFAYSKTISMNFNRQEQTNWCWTATSQSIIDKIALRNPTQSQIVTNIKGSPVIA